MKEGCNGDFSPEICPKCKIDPLDCPLASEDGSIAPTLTPTLRGVSEEELNALISDVDATTIQDIDPNTDRLIQELVEGTNSFISAAQRVYGGQKFDGPSSVAVRQTQEELDQTLGAPDSKPKAN
ncbi:MAG: hypothetical protein WCT53_02675 [Candidatus Gracilibacteria bacterium]|jgi:hypothetical protein